MKAITDPDPQTALKLDTVGTFRRLMRKTRVISLVSSLGSIAVFGIGGYCLDLALDKKNFCTIIGLVVGFVVMNILSVIMSKRMWERERSAQGRV
ncbi:hypothetical protein IJJ27_01330 [bacterium]|nr:hypothetical protein [bacterium]